MSASQARVFGLALVAVLAILSPLRAQDYFETKKREMAVQAQKTVADVQTALDTSRKLEKTDAEAAKTLLLKRLLEVNDSTSLEDKQRGDLQKKLRSRLGEVEATVREQRFVSGNKSQLEADKAARDERERMEQAKLNGQGKSTFDQAKGRFEAGNKTVDAFGSAKDAKAKGFSDVTLDIYKTASKMDEQRITSYFVAKSEQRMKGKLTKEEAALLKILNSTISVDYNSNSLREVIDELDTRTGGLNIFLDKASMTDADVDYSTKVTFKAKKVTVRTVLKKIFGDLGLIYVIKDAGIQVVTPDRAKDFLVTRAYPVQDLVTPFNNLKFNQFAQAAIAYQQAQQLMQMIVGTIEPNSWVGVGDRGYGTISYNEATKTIIVRHSAEMHYMLGGGIGR